MELTRKEFHLRKENERPPILQDFLSKSLDMMKDLKADAKSAEVRLHFLAGGGGGGVFFFKLT